MWATSPPAYTAAHAGFWFVFRLGPIWKRRDPANVSGATPCFVRMKWLRRETRRRGPGSFCSPEVPRGVQPALSWKTFRPAAPNGRLGLAGTFCLVLGLRDHGGGSRRRVFGRLNAFSLPVLH